MRARLTSRGIILLAGAVAALGLGSNGANAGSRLIVSPETVFAMQMVAAHNRLRADEGVQPSLWDHQLAAAAATYAAELAKSERFAHSPQDGRGGQGENLWMGTRGAFSFDRMVSDWGSEKKMFRAGQFPDVSTTGRWQDVGHFTQIIWPASVRVGCAVRSSAQYDYLVCRYGEGGNVYGQRVGKVGLASR